MFIIPALFALKVKFLDTDRFLICFVNFQCCTVCVPHVDMLFEELGMGSYI